MEDKFNAINARQRANKNLLTFDNILSEIESAAGLGQFSVRIQGSVSRETEQLIRELGYDLRQVDDGFGSGMTEFKW